MNLLRVASLVASSSRSAIRGASLLVVKVNAFEVNQTAIHGARFSAVRGGLGLIPAMRAIGVCRRLVLPFCLIYGLDFQPDRIHWHVGNTLSGLRREHPIPLFRQTISLRGLTERSLAPLISVSFHAAAPHSTKLVLKLSASLGSHLLSNREFILSEVSDPITIVLYIPRLINSSSVRVLV